jgi:spore germination protein YaaH
MKRSCFVFILIWLSPLLLFAGNDSIYLARRLKVNKTKPVDTLRWKTSRKLALNENYKTLKRLFILLNGDSQTVALSGIADADEVIYDPARDAYYKKRNKRPLKSGKHVLGWHAYWMKDEVRYYHYEYLTDLIFFAYDIDPNSGLNSDVHADSCWRTTPIADSVKKYNNNFLLCVTSYGADNNSKILNNPDCQQIFRDSLYSLLKSRGANGVDLDFTGINTPELAVKFTVFVQSLRKKLGDSMLVYIHIPALEKDRKFLDIKKISGVVDLFVLNGYDYEYINNTIHEPMVPLSKTKNNQGLDSLLAWCKRKEIKSSSLVLNMPLYGAEWTMSENGKWEVREIPYEVIQANYVAHQKYTDVTTGSTFIKFNTGVVWFESGESLNRKFAWAKENDFAGVGLWGLAYAGENTDVWNSVLDHFAYSRIVAITPVSIQQGTIYSLFDAIRKQRKLIGYSMLLLVFMILAGTLLSLLDWRVREVFFRNYLYRTILMVVALCLLVCGVIIFSDELGSFWMFFFGMLAGSLVMYLISRFYLQYRKKMP